MLSRRSSTAAVLVCVHFKFYAHESPRQQQLTVGGVAIRDVNTCAFTLRTCHQRRKTRMRFEEKETKREKGFYYSCPTATLILPGSSHRIRVVSKQLFGHRVQVGFFHILSVHVASTQFYSKPRYHHKKNSDYNSRAR